MELSRKNDMSCPLLCFNNRKQFSKFELAILSSLRIAASRSSIFETARTSSFEMEMRFQMYTHRDIAKPYKHAAPHFYISYYVVCTIKNKKENAGKGHSLFIIACGLRL